MKLICKNCQVNITIPDTLVGKVGKCPNCQVFLRIVSPTHIEMISTTSIVCSNCHKNLQLPKEKMGQKVLMKN